MIPSSTFSYPKLLCNDFSFLLNAFSLSLDTSDRTDSRRKDDSLSSREIDYRFSYYKQTERGINKTVKRDSRH